MAEVPDNLAPMDGLTNAKIEFVSFDVQDAGATVHFALTDALGVDVGVFPIEVYQTEQTTSADALIALAHQEMIDVLRQYIYRLDVLGRAYERQSAPPVEE